MSQQQDKDVRFAISIPYEILIIKETGEHIWHPHAIALIDTQKVENPALFSLLMQLYQKDFPPLIEEEQKNGNVVGVLDPSGE